MSCAFWAGSVIGIQQGAHYPTVTGRGEYPTYTCLLTWAGRLGGLGSLAGQFRNNVARAGLYMMM